ncbi:class I SAM-dependent methyltransferase [Cytophaga aurantiaca]|uniref:class I SAM-dependent methyltransferase n=1 Tax=Cytophaga aurantiaca TaxID=29530 RepID=UPI00037286B2|nr:class I SAM-dependent methyltransferase [Cytophaga aurantiaca]
MNKGYDRIAPIYDAIAGIFSFNQINKSQLAFLSHLSNQATCLILGGGTGYFLQKILEENKTIQVTYVEASVKMIESAQKRIAANLPNELHRIIFIHEGAECFSFEKYDIIVCNYFLDLFDDMYVTFLVGRFKQHLNNNGLLYITDFSIPEKGLMHWSTKAGVKVLYKFFKWTTNLQTQKLPAIDTVVRGKGFYVLETKEFFKGILKCTLYK